jgi:hypothetical protein
MTKPSEIIPGSARASRAVRRALAPNTNVITHTNQNQFLQDDEASSSAPEVGTIPNEL